MFRFSGFRKARLLGLTASMVLVGSGALLAAPPGSPTALAAGLPSTLTLVPHSAAPAGPETPLPANAPWSFGLVLPSQNEAGLLAQAAAVSDPTSPQYHHFLTHAQIMAEYGPSPATTQSIQGYLQGHGFATSLAGDMLTVQGTVGQVNGLFQTTLARIGPPPGQTQGPGGMVAPTGPLTVPGALQAAVGVTGLVTHTVAPLLSARPLAGHQAKYSATDVPAPPGSQSTTVQSGPMTVTAKLLSRGPRIPGMAVRYLITTTLSGQPDTAAGLAGLSGPFQGAAPFIDTTLTNAQGQFVLDFSLSQAQSASLDASVGDGTYTATVPLPAATFVGPDAATCDLGSTVLCPWNPASNPVTAPFHATALSDPSAAQGPASLAVYTAGAVTSTSIGDVNAFASTFGLPAPQVSVAYTGPNACTATEQSCAAYLPGYEEELSLDLQMMETSSPGANIQVYEAGSLRSALNQVVNQDTAHVFSISYGAGELAESEATPTAQSGWDLLAAEANLEGITITISAGDGGAYEGAQYGLDQPMPSYPANSPYVSALGGTEDAVSPTGRLDSSALWGGNLGAEISPSTLLSFLSLENMMGGGGVSQLEPEPAYQALAIRASGRVNPDFSFPASVVTPGYLAFFDGTLYLFGGTSASAPLFAGWVGDLTQQLGTPLGNVNPVIYALAKADPSIVLPVSYGNDGVYAVTPMDNAATGLGQLNMGRLATDLTNLSAILGGPGAGAAPGSQPPAGGPGGPGGPGNGGPA